MPERHPNLTQNLSKKLTQCFTKEREGRGAASAAGREGGGKSGGKKQTDRSFTRALSWADFKGRQKYFCSEIFWVVTSSL